MCQSKGKYCGMWSMGSPAFLLSSAAANKAAAIHWGSTAAICGQEKKNCSSAQCLCCAWGAVSCALLDMITWIDIISYFVKPAEWSGEMKPATEGEKALEKERSWFRVQLCRWGVLRGKCGGVAGQRWGAGWGAGGSVLGAMTAPEYPSGLPFICWGLGNLFWPCI